MKTNLRTYSFVDHVIQHLDKGIKCLLSDSLMGDHPGAALTEGVVTPNVQKKIAGLMRINHSGEVCAQALYLGQSLTARNPDIRMALQHAADEETLHLSWCAQRLQELDAKSSYFNPFWFMGSFSIGVFAGILGDKISLGFLHETENQVVKHLNHHLTLIPPSDQRTRAILEQMKQDEAQHATLALEQGAVTFPAWIKQTMQVTSKLMTTATYYV